MDIDMALRIYDLMDTIKQAVFQLYSGFEGNDNRMEFAQQSEEIFGGLVAVKGALTQNSYLHKQKYMEAVDSAMYSLADIVEMAEKGNDNKSILWKIECEFLLIIENFTLEFFGREIYQKNRKYEKQFMELKNDTGLMGWSLSEEKEYSCDLSIFMPAFNQVKYSKMCVESIIENIPQGIKVDVILLNNGSSDETRQYFESLSNVHVINIHNNRCINSAFARALSGKYSLYVSNDIIIGKNAIENLYKAITENEDYGFLVPSTPAVSNLQTIPAEYDSLEGFYEFAEKNNVYDVKRHEQRVRLCNPVTMINTSIYNRVQSDFYEQMYLGFDQSSFPDDRISLWMRRNGYKNILMKDSFCHHFGSITHRNDFDKQKDREEYYLKGRMNFIEEFGVDPWGTGTCFDLNIIENMKIEQKNDIEILGINCGLGSNPLKVKEMYVEAGSNNVKLTLLTQNCEYFQDIRGISDRAMNFNTSKELASLIENYHYSFIFIEENVKGLDCFEYTAFLDGNNISYDTLVYRCKDGWKIVKS